MYIFIFSLIAGGNLSRRSSTSQPLIEGILMSRNSKVRFSLPSCACFCRCSTPFSGLVNVRISEPGKVSCMILEQIILLIGSSSITMKSFFVSWLIISRITLNYRTVLKLHSMTYSFCQQQLYNVLLPFMLQEASYNIAKPMVTSAIQHP